MVRTKIMWIKYEECGKKVIPPANLTFYPMIKLDTDDEMINWSFFLINKEFVSDFVTISDVDFLLEEAPHYLLKSGIKFTLYEGAKKIAYGEII